VRLHYFAAWSLIRLFSRAYFRWRVLHTDRVPARGPVIVAANHASYLDPPLVGAAVHREMHYLARESLFRHPLSRWILNECNAVPLDREGGGAAGLKAILQRLQTGAGIVLFPEGTRSPDGALQRARSGVGLLIIKTSCSVVPARVFGTWAAFGRHLRIPRPRQVIIKFGEPLDFAPLRTEAAQCARPHLRVLYQEATAHVMKAIAALQAHTEVARFPAHQ
jgi:1-acyl-sn-glycerol-3-phosphate acyltransferase